MVVEPQRLPPGSPDLTVHLLWVDQLSRYPSPLYLFPSSQQQQITSFLLPACSLRPLGPNLWHDSILNLHQVTADPSQRKLVFKLITASKQKKN